MAEHAPVIARQRPTDTERVQRARDAARMVESATQFAVPPQPGLPIDDASRARLDRLLGRDLSGVRLHHDEFAADLTDALGAQAVTRGNDVWFAPDAPALTTAAGRALLVHELVHSAAGTGALAVSHGEEEAAAERAGSHSDEWTQWPVSHGDIDRGEAPGQPAGQVSDVQDAAGIEADDRTGAARDDAAGSSAHLGRRAKTLLARPDEGTPDLISAGEAMVRLVDRLFARDSDDAGGRVAGVLGRLDKDLRDAVITTVAARNGRHVGSQLSEIANRSAPEDGGRPAAPALPIVDDQSATQGEDEADTGDGTQAGEPAATTADAKSARNGGGDGVAVATVARESGADAPAAERLSETEPTETEPTETEDSEQPPAAAQVKAEEAKGAADNAAGGAGGEPAASDGGSIADVAPSVEGGASAAPAEGAQEASIEAAADTGGGVADAQTEAQPEATTDADAPGAGSPAGESESAGGSAEAADPQAAAALAEVNADVAAAAPQPAEQAADFRSSASGIPAAMTPADGSVDTATPALPTTPDAPATAFEPEDPPEITDPPQAESDAQPSLPTPQPPIEDPAAPVAAAVADTPAASSPQGDAGPAGDETPASLPSVETEPPGDVGEVPAAPTPDGSSAAAAAGPGQENTPAGAAPSPTGGSDGADVQLDDPPVPSGGGGGGSAIADPPEPAAPDVSAMAPTAALGAVAGLPPSKLAANLSGVSASAQRTVGEGQADLAANPPSMERPSGVPADKDASLPAAPLPPLPQAPDHSVKADAAGPGAPPPTPASAPPAPASVTSKVGEAQVGGDTPVSKEDAARIQGAVKGLPTTDPALRVTAGVVPALKLVGAEDPARVAGQAAQVAVSRTGLQTDGLADARTDMGENGVLPHVPPETLTAELEAGAAGGAAAGGSDSGGAQPATAAAQGAGGAAGAQGPTGGEGAAVPSLAIDAIAAEKSGATIAAATQTQGAALTKAGDDHATSATTAKTETDRQINDEIAANGSDQTATRRAVRSEVGKERAAWVGEQKALATKSGTASADAVTTADGTMTAAQDKAETDATTAVDHGNEEIEGEREKAEQDAREKKAKAEKESEEGGFFSWLGSKVASFFDGIKKAISAVFDLARKAVDLAISVAQKVAVAAIEAGRVLVVAAIEVGGKALALAGDIVLGGFPETRARFRKSIEEKVESAKKTVNELADKLKAGVKKLLDGLGKLLKAALSLLESAYKFAIDAVAKVVDSAIKSAKAFVDALVGFAMIIGDIAANPGQWLRNLGASLMDGVRNHVIPSLISAVKNWFKQTVESVIGVGAALITVLRTGGITFGKIVGIAWTAIKESLPGILIQLLIEKLIAILIPVAGALALIIDGLRAAWGAASQILAAFQKFLVFLKAVKGGNAGRQFGELVGAVAVAVISFLANFVLIKLKGAGQKVGGTLRKLAEKFMKVVKKVAGGIKRGAKAAAGVVKRGIVAAGQAVKKGAVAAAKAIKKVIPKGVLKLGAKAVRFVGAQVKKGVAKVKAAYAKAKEKLFGKKKNRPKETKEQKLARVLERTNLAITKLGRVGASRLRWAATLTWLKLRYRWSRLDFLRDDPSQATVHGEINPFISHKEHPTVKIKSHSGKRKVGSMQFLELTEHVDISYGSSKSQAFDYEREVTKHSVRSAVEQVGVLKDMIILEPSQTMASGKRQESASTTGRPMGDDTALPLHAQMELRKGGQGLRTTIPDVLGAAPTRNTMVAQETQLITDYGARDHANVLRDLKRGGYAGDKIMQFDNRLAKLGARMKDPDGEFAQRAKAANAGREKKDRLKPRIVIIFIAPDFPNKENTTRIIIQQVQDFVDSEFGKGIFVEVIWIKNPIA